jgi:hypothetical protein
MASLRELQQSFAAALRDPAVACAVFPPANLGVYRNNARVAFREALERKYPVVRRRVGDDYFRQLGLSYRERFPSRSGDLHFYGRDFAAFLDEHHAGGDYAWLGDLARLEWLRVECAIALELPALDVDSLASHSGEALEHLVFGLQPSLRLHASPFPVFTVWLNNQVENAPPTDQSLASEGGMVHLRYDSVQVRPLAPSMFSFLSALAGGRALGDAMTRAALDEAALTESLRFVFSQGLVCSVTVNAAGAGQREGTSS